MPLFCLPQFECPKNFENSCSRLFGAAYWCKYSGRMAIVQLFFPHFSRGRRLFSKFLKISRFILGTARTSSGTYDNHEPGSYSVSGSNSLVRRDALLHVDGFRQWLLLATARGAPRIQSRKSIARHHNFILLILFTANCKLRALQPSREPKNGTLQERQMFSGAHVELVEFVDGGL